jgi:hypothetical protein
MYSASRSVSADCGSIPKKPFGAGIVGFAAPDCAPRTRASSRQAARTGTARRRFIENGKVASR